MPTGSGSDTEGETSGPPMDPMAQLTGMMRGVVELIQTQQATFGQQQAALMQQQAALVQHQQEAQRLVVARQGVDGPQQLVKDF